MVVETKNDEHQTSGRLLDNLVLFGRLLRELGFDISSSRMISIVKALEFVNIARKDDFYHTLSCLLVRLLEETWTNPLCLRLSKERKLSSARKNFNHSKIRKFNCREYLVRECGR